MLHVVKKNCIKLLTAVILCAGQIGEKGFVPYKFLFEPSWCDEWLLEWVTVFLLQYKERQGSGILNKLPKIIKSVCSRPSIRF